MTKSTGTSSNKLSVISKRLIVSLCVFVEVLFLVKQAKDTMVVLISLSKFSFKLNNGISINRHANIEPLTLLR